MQQNVKDWAGIKDFKCKEQPSGDASLPLLTLVCQKKLFVLATILHVGAHLHFTRILINTTLDRIS